MANKISGKIIVLTPIQTMTSKSGNSYQKRDVVIERIVFDRNTGQPTSDPFDTPIFSLIGDSCAWLDKAKPGDEIVIDYELRGRSYQKDGETRYLNDIRVFRIDIKGESKANSQEPNANGPDPFASSSNDAPAALAQATAMPLPTAQQLADDDLLF